MTRFAHTCVVLFLITGSQPLWAGDAVVEESGERVVRERFLLAYQTAQNPERKAETAEMLRGLKEPESHRLLAGMLGDRLELVRIKACEAIAGTPDPRGYFLKPLLGLLSDPSDIVRVAAARAHGSATLKADAVKALAFAMMNVVGQLRDDQLQRGSPVVEAFDRALQRLTGASAPDRNARTLSSFWMDYWKKNEEHLREADRALLGPEPPDPVRSPNLPRDSFDKKP